MRAERGPKTHSEGQVRFLVFAASLQDLYLFFKFKHLSRTCPGLDLFPGTWYVVLGTMPFPRRSLVAGPPTPYPLPALALFLGTEGDPAKLGVSTPTKPSFQRARFAPRRLQCYWFSLFCPVRTFLSFFSHLRYLSCSLSPDGSHPSQPCRLVLIEKTTLS